MLHAANAGLLQNKISCFPSSIRGRQSNSKHSGCLVSVVESTTAGVRCLGLKVQQRVFGVWGSKYNSGCLLFGVESTEVQPRVFDVWG